MPTPIPTRPRVGPLSADELPVPPAPVMLPLVEQDVPADLETPLAMYDPDALPPVPTPPARVLAALAPGERLETFTLSPPPPPQPAPASRPSEPPSIDALLQRLEQGARRRTALNA